MKKLIFVFIIFLCCSGCITTQLQVLSENTKANSENVLDLANQVKQYHDSDAIKGIINKSIKDLDYSKDAVEMKKGIITTGDAVEGLKKVAPAVGSLFGVAPAYTESALGIIILWFLGKGAKKGAGLYGESRRKREKQLAEAKPEDARKLL